MLVPSRLRREPDLIRVVAFVRDDYVSSDDRCRVILVPLHTANRLLDELLSHVFLGLGCRGADLTAKDLVLRGGPRV